jgi:hypothetical protein
MDDAIPMDAASHAAHLPELRAHAEHAFAQALEANAPEYWREAIAVYQELVAHNPAQGEYWWRLVAAEFRGRRKPIPVAVQRADRERVEFVSSRV